MHRPDIEPVPELFDIHVMAFADESSTTVDALARVFAIGRDEAQRLISDAPVVVKRAATPAVADALLDVLGGLGAQVVLLPSQTVKAQTPPAASAHVEAPELVADGADDERDFFASGPMPSDPAPAPPVGSPEAAVWGGLDLEVPRHGHANAPRAVLDEELQSYAYSEAQEPPAPRSPPPRSAPYASFAPPSSPRYLAPEAEIDREASYGELDESEEEPWRGATEASEPAPAPEYDTSSLELAVPIPARRMTQLEPPPPPSRSAAPPFARRPGPPSPTPDLGLGLVPPLPGLGSLPPPPPPSAAVRSAQATSGKASGLAAPRASAARAPAPLLSEAPRSVVRAPAAAPVRSGAAGKPESPRAANAPAPPQAAWLSRADVPSGPDLPRFVAPAAAPAVPSATPAIASPAAPAGPLKLEERGRARSIGGTAEALPQRSGRKPRMLAVLELVGGVAVFALGLQLDNTILHGNADTVWLALHALALYGIGSGLYGLRP